jgi:hypothetical protein
MARKVKRIEVTTPDDEAPQTVERTKETEVMYDQQPSIGDFLNRIVYFLLGIIETILALRVLLTLLGADPANAFASFIYQVSRPLAQPFFTLFGHNVVDSELPRIEAGTLAAMVVYALTAAAIVGLVNIGRRR